MLIMDFDNYDGELTTEDIVACKRAGMQGAIVGLQAPAPPYPPFVAYQQIEALYRASVPIVACYAQSQHIRDTWPLVAPFRGLIPMVYVTAEEPHVNREWLDSNLWFIDDLGLERRAGIYTGSWWWQAQPFAGEYRDRALWAAQYDGNPDAEQFVPFGAWRYCELKQWNGHARIGRLDLDLNADRRWR